MDKNSRHITCTTAAAARTKRRPLIIKSKTFFFCQSYRRLVCSSTHTSDISDRAPYTNTHKNRVYDENDSPHIKHFKWVPFAFSHICAVQHKTLATTVWWTNQETNSSLHSTPRSTAKVVGTVFPCVRSTTNDHLMTKTR